MIVHGARVRRILQTKTTAHDHSPEKLERKDSSHALLGSILRTTSAEHGSPFPQQEEQDAGHVYCMLGLICLYLIKQYTAQHHDIHLARGYTAESIPASKQNIQYRLETSHTTDKGI